MTASRLMPFRIFNFMVSLAFVYQVCANRKGSYSRSKNQLFYLEKQQKDESDAMKVQENFLKH